jgi:hypothetical protein
MNVITQFAYLRSGEQKGDDWKLLLERLSRIDEIAPTGGVVGLDVQSVDLAYIAALFTRSRPTWILSGRSPVLTFNPAARFILPADFQNFALLKAAISDAQRKYESVHLIMGGSDHVINRYSRAVVDLDQNATVFAPAADQTVLNGSSRRPAGGKGYLVRADELSNHLLQIDSSLAHIVVPGYTENVGLWPLETDFADPRHGIQAMGRYLLMEVLNPIPNSQLLFDFSSSPLGAAGGELPPAVIVGNSEVPVGLVGRGAGRVLSDPLAMRVVDGHNYLAIDLGVQARRFPFRRHTVLGLYNGHLGLDPRSLVGFARNISLLTPAQVGSLSAPDAIESFPAGLFQPGLLYSGIYEDGWMGEAARMRLNVSQGFSRLNIRGQMPGGLRGEHERITLQILIDGTLADERKVEPGSFDLEIPLHVERGSHWIELRADTVRALSGGDGRHASVLLKSIAVVATNGAY